MSSPPSPRLLALLNNALEASIAAELLSAAAAAALPFELRPAFAITVHDAQGGEFDHVHIIMPPSEKSPLCTLEMLYTAVSRARQSLTLWCLQRDLSTFQESLCRVSPLRATPFKAQLKSTIH